MHTQNRGMYTATGENPDFEDTGMIRMFRNLGTRS